MDIKDEDFMKLPKYEEKSIVASVVAGFAAGVTCVFALLKLFGKD